MERTTYSRVAFFIGRIVMLMALLTLSTRGAAQYYTLGADPAGAKWMQLKGEHHTVIYPQENDSLARRYLYLFEKNRELINKGLLIEPSKVPIILHPYTAQSNGMVAWAPKRIELITTPPAFDGYADNWEHLLTVHEGRHLGQMTHYTKGIFGVLQAIFGEQAVAVGTGFYPSGWNLEGDAVLNETDFSYAGRGRSAQFLMYFKSAFDQGDIRTYDHWRYGSYGRYSPDKYSLGYLMMSFMRYSSDDYFFFGETMHNFKKDWWRVFSVWNTSFEKAMGYTPRRNFWRMIPFYQDLWQKDAEARGKYSVFEPLTFDVERRYADYKDPLPVGDEIIATKSGFEYSRRLVSIDKEANVKYLRPFSSNTSAIVHEPGTNTIYWSEIVPDLRWELQSYSIVRSYDLKTKEIKNITQKSKIFNPTVSDRGLAAVEYPTEGGSNVVLLDKVSGETKFRKVAPENGQVTESVVMGDDIYATCITEEGMGIYRANLADASEEWVKEIDPQSYYIQNLRCLDTTLYFSSDFDGVNNVFYYNPSIKLLRRLTNAKYGAFDATFSQDGKNLFYTDFEHMGHRPVYAPADSLDWSLADMKKPYRYQVADHLARQAKMNTTPMSEEEDEALKEAVDKLEPKRYNKFAHLLRFHSWMPLYANIDRIMDMSYDHYYQLASLGATVISQNDLGTATALLGYSYHNGFHSGHINFNYSGLFPVFELAVDYNDRFKTKTSIIEATGSGEMYPIRYQIDTTAIPTWDASVNVYVPLNLSRSGWNSGLIPQIKYTFSNDMYSLFGSKFRTKKNLSYGVRYYRMLSVPKSALMPRWGFGVSINGAFAYGPHNESGNLVYLYAYGYLPGITRQQGIKLTCSYQKQYTGDFFGFLPNLASAPRGYSSYIMMDYSKATIDYALPIYLNDVTWPWLYYLKRLQLVGFADFALDQSPYYPENWYIVPTKSRLLYSYGTDVVLNLHFLRIGAELGIGFRYARTADKRNYFNVLFNTSL